jgi:hypothetical protein
VRSLLHVNSGAIAIIRITVTTTVTTSMVSLTANFFVRHFVLFGLTASQLACVSSGASVCGVFSVGRDLCQSLDAHGSVCMILFLVDCQDDQVLAVQVFQMLDLVQECLLGSHLCQCL